MLDTCFDDELKGIAIYVYMYTYTYIVLENYNTKDKNNNDKRRKWERRDVNHDILLRPPLHAYFHPGVKHFSSKDNLSPG